MADDFKFEDEDRPEDLFKDPLGGDEDIIPGNGDIEEKEVQVVGVYESRDQGGHQSSEYVVLLKDSRGRSVLILIGKFEAMAISLAHEGAAADRPLTHDLLNNVVSKMGGTVERILIDDLWNNTYYAKISITNDGKQVEFDSRPSDAIALALRAKAPIFMAEAVLERASIQEE